MHGRKSSCSRMAVVASCPWGVPVGKHRRIASNAHRGVRTRRHARGNGCRWGAPGHCPPTDPCGRRLGAFRLLRAPKESGRHGEPRRSQGRGTKDRRGPSKASKPNLGDWPCPAARMRSRGTALDLPPTGRGRFGPGVSPSTPGPPKNLTRSQRRSGRSPATASLAAPNPSSGSATIRADREVRPTAAFDARTNRARGVGDGPAVDGVLPLETSGRRRSE